MTIEYIVIEWIIPILMILVMLYLVAETMAWSAYRDQPFLRMDVIDKFFYKYKPNQHKYQRDYLRNLGPRVPKIHIYSEGIRTEIKKQNMFHPKGKVLCLGCSITEGAAYKTEDTYPGQLQKMVSEYDVVNAGISGYSIKNVFMMLRHLYKYKPKVVVVQLYDFARTNRETKFPSWFARHSKLALYIHPILQKSKVTLDERRQENAQNQEKLWENSLPDLLGIEDYCKELGAKLVLFLSPSWFWNGDYFHEKLMEHCAQQGIATFDLRNMLSFYKREEITIKHDYHPNVKGNHLIAKAVWNCIRNE